MDGYYKDKELDEVKAAMEKLKEDYQIKTELSEGLRKAHNEQLIKLQEAKVEIEKQAQELNAKAEEISFTTQMCEDLKSKLHEKESVLRHLSSANDKRRADFGDKLLKLEGENRELLSALDEANLRNKDQEQKILVYKEEIEGLKGLLSLSQKKCFEAEQRVQASKELRQRDDLLEKLEEESRKVKDQLKWKKEQFKHLEEAHEKLQNQFRASKREWELEKSTLVDEICSLQTSLDSQTRISEDLQSRLQMCNQALAHEESRRKFLEVQVSESKTCYENVFVEFQEAKSKIESLTSRRDEEIAALRNSLGKKETLFKEIEYRRGHLEQENQELLQSLKELQEDQINKSGTTSSMAKLRNKLKGLEQVHRGCLTNLKAKEAEWSSQMEKMTKDLNDCRNESICKDKQMQEFQMELEDCYSSMLQLMLHNEEISVRLILLETGLSEAFAKLSNLKAEMQLLSNDTNEKLTFLTEQLEKKNNALVKAHAEIEQERDKAASLVTRIESFDLIEQQHFLMQKELQRCKEMLEESFVCQLRLKEQALQMQNALKQDLRKASDALDKANFELDEKICEGSEIEFELQTWKSFAERLKGCLDENQEIRREMEASLLAQAVTEQALKQDKESLLRIADEKDKRIADLNQHIILLKQQLMIKETESSTLEKMEMEKTLKQERENFLQIAEVKDTSIENLRQEIACLEQEFTRRELEGVILAQIEAEKALEEEKERLLRESEEKDQNIEDLQQLIVSMKQDFARSVDVNVRSELAEKEAQVNMLHEAWEKITTAELLAEVEIQEKNLLIFELEEQISNLHQKLELQEKSLSCSKQHVEQLQAVLEEKQLEIEKGMDQLINKLKTSRGLIEELESEKSLFLNDRVKLSSEREDLLSYIRVFWDRISEFFGEDAELMGRLDRIVQSCNQENELGMDLNDEIYNSSRENVNGPLSPRTKKVEASPDGRSPLKELNKELKN